MKALLLTSLVVMSGLTAGSAFADCTEPTAVTEVPKGVSASRDDMLAAQRAVKTFDSAVKEYTACLQRAGDSSSKGNDAIDKLQKIAERFNQELRAFKQKNATS